VFSNCRSKIPFLSFLSLLFFPLVLLFPFLAFYSPGKYQSRFSREKHSTLNTGLISFPNFPPMLSPSHCHRSILLIPPILVSAHAVFSFLFCIFSRSRVLAFLISEWTDIYIILFIENRWLFLQLSAKSILFMKCEKWLKYIIYVIVIEFYSDCFFFCCWVYLALLKYVLDYFFIVYVINWIEIMFWLNSVLEKLKMR
jgi:hypothetical protein